MNIHYTTQFKKDYKRIKKQNKDPDQLKVVIAKLVAGKKLEPKYRDHWLSGDWKGHRDCHIEPDWILIYRIEDEDIHDLIDMTKAKIVRHGKKVRITLDIAEELVQEIDQIRQSIGVDRSALIKIWLHERVQKEKAGISS